MNEPEKELLSSLLENNALWYPLPGPQMDAYLCAADELFYGGAAGGGKSDLLIGLAATAHRRSIIFRREYPQLQAIVDRSREIIGDAGRFNGQTGIWRLNDQRVIELGACQHEHDVSKFQGRPHDLKAFDELPYFTEAQYRFLNGWMRTTVPGQRTRSVAAGNPPTSAEGEWVIRRWGAWLDGQHHNPARPGELRWYAMVDGQDTECEDGTPFEWKGETITPKSRTFIPARLSDNPYLMATDYGATLQAMPEPMRSQMLYGDFSIGLDDDPWQVIPTAWVRAAQERWAQTEKPDMPMTAIGVDPARGGKDKTVLAPRYGTWFAPLQKHAGKSTPDGPYVAALVMQAMDPDACVNLDIIGVGASVFDQLVDRVRMVGVNNSAQSTARDKSGRMTFMNIRAETYWRLREALDPVTGDNIALPPDPELLSDLCAPRWRPRTGGIQVEAKEEIIKRIGRSPDCGDAVVLANYSGLSAAGLLGFA